MHVDAQFSVSLHATLKSEQSIISKFYYEYNCQFDVIVQIQGSTLF